MTPQPNPTPKRVRVTGAKLPTYWYARHLGSQYKVIDGPDTDGDYRVRHPDGDIAYIDARDCIVIDPPTNAPTQAPDIVVNVVEFALRLDSGYTCRTPGDRSGKYVTLADAEKLAAAPARLQADLLVYRQLVGARDGQIEALKAEVAAYKKAKSENDERFMVERDEARARVAELEKELKVTDNLLDECNRVLEAIPECGAHGHHCIPNALDWIEDAKSGELRASVNMREARARAERLAAALSLVRNAAALLDKTAMLAGLNYLTNVERANAAAEKLENFESVLDDAALAAAPAETSEPKEGGQ